MPTTPEPAPGPPWLLKGEVWLSVWLAPLVSIDAAPPPGWRLARLGGRLVVGAFWARYGAGGLLAYDELAVGVLVRRGMRLAVTVPWIWVDNPFASEGGRRNWAIPKRLAQFRGSPDIGAEAVDDDGPIARLRWRPRGPGLMTVVAPVSLAQPGESSAVSATGRVSGRLQFGRASWASAGSLSMLQDLAPILSFHLSAASLALGPARRD